MREEARILKDEADAAFFRRRFVPVAELNSVRPPATMRPDCGRAVPAIILSRVDLPAPDGPNSAVTPAPAWKAVSISKLPARPLMSTCRVFMRVLRR